MRTRSLTADVIDRAYAYVDRRGGAGMRRGGRGRGSATRLPANIVVDEQGNPVVDDAGNWVVT